MAQTNASVTAYVGLGSNLDCPRQHVEAALNELRHLPATHLRRHSSLYTTPPMGPTDQPDYVNAVAELVTSLPPHTILDELQKLEMSHGRIRNRHWGPRTLDLDLLLYGTLIINDSTLTVPHPGLAERAFVVVPLFEIAPDLVLPGLGPLRPLRQQFADLPLQQL